MSINMNRSGWKTLQSGSVNDEEAQAVVVTMTVNLRLPSSFCWQAARG